MDTFINILENGLAIWFALSALVMSAFVLASTWTCRSMSPATLLGIVSMSLVVRVFVGYAVGLDVWTLVARGAFALGVAIVAFAVELGLSVREEERAAQGE